MKIDQEIKMKNFFKTEIDVKSFSQTMRRFMHVAVMQSLEQEEISQRKDWIIDGHYFLTEFLEAIDPLLEDIKE